MILVQAVEHSRHLQYWAAACYALGELPGMLPELRGEVSFDGAG